MKHEKVNMITVRFPSKLTIHYLEDENEIRRGPWEDMARDRARFHHRIDSLRSILDKILSPEHRLKALKRVS